MDRPGPRAPQKSQPRKPDLRKALRLERLALRLSRPSLGTSPEGLAGVALFPRVSP